MKRLNELEKLELKRALYLNGSCFFRADSLNNNEIINPIFQAIDKGVYNQANQRIRPRQHKKPKIEVYLNKHKFGLFNQLKQGNKIVLGVGGVAV